MRFIDIILHEFRIDMPADGEDMGIPRKKMPQIKTKDYPEYFQYLKDNGVDFQKLDGVKAATLKPTQSEFSKQGVEKQLQKMWDKNDGDKPLIASSDDYIIDGHHRWLVAKNTRRPLTIFKADIPMKELMALTLKFPKVYFKDIYNEGYKLQLERDAEMLVLNITDTKTGKRTEVRGKSGYESGNYDPNDKLHQLLDKIGKSANISDLINGDPVGINPKHPQGTSAKKATDIAFNESKGGLPVKTLKGLYHVGTLDASKKRDGFEGAGLSVSTHPDAWKRIAKGHVTGDTYSATKEGNRFLDAHNLTKEHNAEITQWAIKNGYLEQQETVTVCYYDDEMEDDLCQTFDSMADAEDEYDDELQHMDVTVDKGGIVPTEKLKKETRQTRMSATSVLEYVLPIFAEQQGLDGVWWQDTLDVQRYSAPRGVIVPSKIKSWKFTVNEATDVAFNENVSALASELEAKYNLKDLFLSDMASRNAIELSSIIVNKEEQGKGTGSKVMQELIKYADDNGKIMVLDPGLLDKKHGTTSQSRLRKFYKQFGFIDNKGRNKNYEFRNLMIRYPQTNETTVTEAFDNPYPFKLSGPSDSQGFVATAQTPNGVLRMDIETTDYDNFGIDFAVGKSMGKTQAGDEFRVFATVVAMVKEWISVVGIEHVESFDFAANKDEHTSDGRARLYARFAKQLASKLGWRLEQSTTANNSHAFFKLTNPKPVPRDDEYWDALEENVTEAAGVGRVVKGVNTTVDVGPDEIIKQVKKYGNVVDRDGFPKKHLR